MGKRIKFRMHAKRNFRGAKAAKTRLTFANDKISADFSHKYFFKMELAQDRYAHEKFIPTVRI